MTISITTLGDPDVLLALEDWLHREPRLRGIRIIRIEPVPEAGHMGILADTVELVDAAGPVLSAVAATVGVWLGTQVRRTRIRVKDGVREVEIDTGTLRDPDIIARTILQQLMDEDST